jgi:hypothetical protein
MFSKLTEEYGQGRDESTSGLLVGRFALDQKQLTKKRK